MRMNNINKNEQTEMNKQCDERQIQCMKDEIMIRNDTIMNDDEQALQ